MKKLKVYSTASKDNVCAFISAPINAVMEVVSITFNANSHEYDVFYYGDESTLKATIGW